MNKIKYFLVVQFLFSLSLCEINNDQKEKFLNGFLKYYNSLPDQVYHSEEGSLQSTQQVDDTTYQIEANLKVAEISNAEAKKSLKCIASLKESDNEVTVLNNHCVEVVDQVRRSDGVPEASLETQVEVTEPTVERKPVQLDNEVTADTAITSGEQFIAIPRDQPSAPCVGCASHVNPQAAGVSDLAGLGVRHLDLHEPSVKHSLASVIDVERQVQVVNGVRYILTLSINFNNCTQVESEICASSRICKITILVKPWVKLPNGGNYRAILANNCTEEWHFGDNGEVLPEPPSDNNQNTRRSSGDPADINAFDGEIQVKHEENVQSQPNEEKSLTEDDIKKIQEQIITAAQFQAVTESYKQSFTVSPDLSDVSKQHVFKESGKYNENSIPVTESQTKQNAFKLNVDKKKAVDEMLDFFDFAGFKPKTEVEEVVPRVRRSYDYDLQVLSLAEDFHGIKNSIKNARFMYEMAQAMVDYLNEMDMEIKNRAVKNVIRAEEEKENLQRFVYIQARVTIPCDKVECEPRDVDTQICNGVIDCINENSPQILSTFCYNDNKERDYRENIREVALNDPVLRKLAEEAVKEIESDSKSQYAIRINKIASAITQVTSGTLTKFSVIVENIKCNKSVPLPLRENCTVLEQLGSKICDIIVHERHWLKEKKMSYTCTDRPADMRISKSKKVSKNITVDDPQIIEMLQEAIQYLESQSDKTNKQKIVSIQSISSQIIAGFLTKIEFVVGYTDCTDENYSRDKINKCELLKNEGLRLCKAQIWDRSWIMDGRQIEVSCDDMLEKNDVPNTRKKRSIDSSWGRDVQNLNKDNVVDYKKLADESLYKFMQSSSSNQHYEVVKVDKTLVPDVSRKLLRIDFSISPTDCLIQDNGILSSSKCNIVNPKNIVHCRSKILENDWIDKKQYFVKCNIKYQQQKNTNTIKERSPSDSKYYQLAVESLKKYLHDTGNPPHTIVRVEKVTTQIVSGLLTRIDFIVSPKNLTVSNSKTIGCHSEILEKHWMGTKVFNVSCMMKQDVKKMDNTVEIKVDNPKYMQIAVESLQKYIKNHPESNLVRVAFVDKVEQKAEKLKIKFIASHAEEDDGDTLCYAEVSDTIESKSDIEVKCHFIGKLFRKADIAEDDPNYYKYVQLADESLRNYLQKMNGSLYTVVTIEGVAVLWDEGLKTLINFTISPVDTEDIDLLQGKQCIAEILEQPWLQNNKNIDVQCKQDKDLYRTKREASIVGDHKRRNREETGGLMQQNPSLRKYKRLAEESLRKYIIDSGIRKPLEVEQVLKVSTQVVAGLLTRIDFLVSGSTDAQINKCHSEVWEQSWRGFKQITVTCENGAHRDKRGIPGGEEHQDPTKPEYKVLAEESLRKYVLDSGIEDYVEVAEVQKVSTQVVAGSLTKIDFLVSGSTNAQINKCHSEVWEQPWRGFKQITVTCENGVHRDKRGIRGGEKHQDPTKPEYKVLAEESLRKYVLDSGIEDHVEVAEIQKVSTQVVAGSLTKIDFLVSGSTNAQINKCHSEVWEQPWRGFKQITVTCENGVQRDKRGTPGGEEHQDPTKPEYKVLAEESLRKYVLDSGIQDHIEVAEVQKVSTQVVAGSLTKIDFLVSGSTNAQINKCHSEVWEQPWRDFKQITVTCENGAHRDKRGITYGEVDQDPTKPEYKVLAEESLRKYVLDSGIQDHIEVAEVQKVSTQVVSGSLTKIDFLVSGSTNAQINKCHSEVWEQPWRDFKQITVTCENGAHRDKRGIPGGEEHQDPTKPEYKVLAEESLRKYVLDSGIEDYVEVAEVQKVSTQVVAGSLTKIDFLVSGSTNAQINKCHSEVWEQPWRGFKQITVTCENGAHRDKRGITYGEVDQDPTKPEYKVLAEESLRKYVLDSGIQDHIEVAEVQKVSTQVVSGSLTKIDFLVSGSTNAQINKCHSEVWEQPWSGLKKITVTCENGAHRDKRGITGGEVDQDPTKPEYKVLAEESLRKYVLDSGIQDHIEVAEVQKVSTQVVAGSLTKIDFLVSGSTNAQINKCHSEVWEQPWRDFKQITVTCENGAHRDKRGITYGEVDQDPTKPEYKVLAEESLRKYVLDSGIQDHIEVAEVQKVSTQVVSGSLTKIDFLVSGSTNAQINKCHSEVWEQPWRGFKQITVTCENGVHRDKRGIRGGEKHQDPTKPEYKVLAEESLRKYVLDSGIEDHVEVAEIQKVSTQVVAGSLTKIDFLVSGSTNAQINKCHSEVWEQPWRGFKQITVTCENGVQRDKRGTPGGEEHQDPTKPEYKVLAEESLRKYVLDSGIQDHIEVAEVQKVSTQVVAGSLTKIDFLVSGSTNAQINKCHSEVWEQPWRDFKQITVTCENGAHRDKRGITYGEVDQDPTKPEYKVLAEESLRKYVLDSGIQDHIEVAEVQKVSTQVVSGSLTKIDFLVSGSTNAQINKCHSEVWEQPWRDFKQITVTCENGAHRDKRGIPGGEEHQDPTKPEYKVLAEESLRKYVLDSGIEDYVEVAEVQKVSTQVVSGSLTKIDFLVSGSTNAQINKCHSEVWEQPWRGFKQITVTCENGAHRDKRGITYGEVDQDPTKPEYKVLAEESLRKYVLDSGIQDHIEVAEVQKVSTQVVSGSLTKIDFLVSGSTNAQINKCHSEVWEQPWSGLKKITVTCENGAHRDKRGITGGEVDQDPTKPEYKVLAEESLRKYVLDSGIQDHIEVAEVQKVSTQVVAGSLTKIDFLVSGSTNAQINKCHSEVWEQPWRDFKQITVTCENGAHRDKRGITYGEVDQDPTKPEYKVLAEESLRKYVLDSGIQDHIEVAEVQKVSTQVVSGSLTKIDFLVSGSTNAQINKCHSEVWEQPWSGLKKITVTCENGAHRDKRGITGGEVDQDPTKPEYKVLAEESLRKYVLDSGIQDHIEVAEVQKVSTQVVAGSLTKIDFLVSGSTNAQINKCHSEVWEQPWRDFKQITVTCENGAHRDKRGITYGEVDQDPTKPEYKVLAEESLRKYVLDSGIQDHIEVAEVQKVSTQVVSGSLTKIDFLVSGSTNAQINKCHSEVWEQPWRDFKQITVTCENGAHRDKRGIPGGEEHQDPTKPEYKVLAEESLRKYVLDSGIEDYVEVAEVQKVSTQVVAGSLTKIDFLVSGSTNAQINKCHSEVWEQPWRGFKQITVTCENGAHRDKRGITYGEVDQDPTKPEYKVLAEESLRKYVLDSGIQDHIEVAEVQKVSTQVVSGSLTKIDFLVSGSTNAQINKCHSEVWEQPWSGLKKITVTCENGAHRDKRGITGGEVDQDPTKPEYKVLAEESLRKYVLDSGIQDHIEVAEVQKVSTQVVAGSLTKIDFLVSGSTNAQINKCHSEVWEQPWRDFKQITVTCENGAHRDKRGITYGEVDQDPTKPEYKVLAEESLRKYVLDSGIQDHIEVAEVQKVSTQVVSGSLTKIDFLVSGSTNAQINKCHSEVWEQPWRGFKQITVTCENGAHRDKRGIPGGEEHQDPTKPEYKVLAEESLRKYVLDSGIEDYVEVAEVQKVSTQVVAGSLTKIDFLVSGSTNAQINKCHSEVWEQPWRGFKQITVTCENGAHRDKRGITYGEVDQDPTKPEYKVLAEESLRKYVLDSGIQDHIEVAEVQKVSTQVVSGSLTKIDFLVSGSTNAQINKCHSEVWEQPWSGLKKITVTCENGAHRDKRGITGGEVDQDPTKPEYKVLAEESLRKYVLDSGIEDYVEVAEVQKVSTQVVAGSLTKIDFLVSGSTNAQINKCHSEVWEQPWRGFKQITVTCENGAHRDKRGITYGEVDQDPTKPEYKVLAEESLRKYVLDSGIQDHIEVAEVQKVSTQVVSGSLTKIDFLVSGSTNAQINKCHSEVWEQPWSGLKKITVTCENGAHRDKRGITGGEVDQDPTKPEYKVLAEESLRKYVLDSGIQDHIEVAEVQKVSTQVVAGSLTKIDFLVSGSTNAQINKCHSEVWEQPWRDFKQITVTCENGAHRDKRGITYGEVDQDPTKPEYKVLAEESLRKYVLDSGIQDHIEVAEVQKVSTQVVSGSLTKIDFLVSGSTNAQINKCHSEVWEQPWSGLKKITVTCENGAHRDKRGITGGEVDQDPTKPEYKVLAEESLRKYVLDSGIQDHIEVAEVQKVSTQVVAGSLTKIDFLVSGSTNAQINKCHSEVWEQPWRDFKQITVTCENGAHRDKRGITYGEVDQDPTKPEYKVLAEESLRKYVLDSGIQDHIEVAEVQKVSTQVVSGSLTKIDFLVSGSTNAQINKCHSEVWEQPWRDFKQITVTCENGAHRDKRGIPGGEEHQDPTKPEYKVLAEESLRKYVLDSGIEDYVEVAEVQKVSTQVVAGSLTKIDFLVSGSTNAQINKCHSEVWEQPWRGFKQITVTCENGAHRDKRGITYGEVDQDPTKPEYKVLAEESLRKYVLDSGIQDHIEVAEVQKVSTQVVSGSLTKIDFLVSGSTNAQINKCHSEVWEQPWSGLKKITVTCENGAHRDKRGITGGEVDQDPTKPEYKVLAEESLRKYVLDSGIEDYVEVAEVQKVSTQVVAGSLTKIDFLVSGSTNAQINKCHSEVWEQPWRGFKQITVTCENGAHRDKRGITYGEVDQDPTKPEYKVLAEESLRKYVLDSGIQDHIEVAEVQKVSTQVVSGSLTKIDFLVSGSTNAQINKCHSEVWEQPWSGLKKITVTCENGAHRDKRGITGGEVDQDPTKPEYKVLAEESLRKYVLDSGIQDHIEVAEVQKVSTQVVAGSLTKIDFLVSGSTNAQINKCHSEVWEQPWRDFKQITVTCENGAHRDKRGITYGEVDQDPTKPEYKVLAEESLRKYVLDSGIQDHIEVAEVQKVSTQVVSGSLTKIDFLVSGSTNAQINKCHSEVWEQPWSGLKKITVTCENGAHRDKRGITGGEVDQDPTKPEYKVLAEESLRKYVLDSGIQDHIEVAEVQKVSTQVVAGSLTKIDFLVSGSTNAQINKCHSEVWEQPWSGLKKITVTCEIGAQRDKRGIPGGEEHQDPTKPEYKVLAEESLRKYVLDSGIQDHIEVAEVQKVSTQVVAGSLTKIDFLVSGSTNAQINKCHSEVWEQPWRDFKQITVACENGAHRDKRGITGGEVDQDPTKPEYKVLAEESLRKYVLESGIKDHIEVAEVQKVSTQVVAGSLTKIDFLVSGSTNGQINKCHSEVWEQPWSGLKKITVTCENGAHRDKRGIPGGEEHQDPTKPEYKVLAEESLRKYVLDSGIQDHIEVAEVQKVSTQVVAGSLTKIDFLVSGSTNAQINKCHSEVWEQPWRDFKQITVACENGAHRDKRGITGGEVDQDPTKPEYKVLAEESLRKYVLESGIKDHIEVAEVQKVSTQFVAGSLTKMDFLVSGSTNGQINKCHSEVWEQPWSGLKKITVTCENGAHRDKRGIPGGEEHQDPTKPEYKVLAEESLRKYVLDSGIQDHIEVAEVQKVSTQVVAGSLTKIDFLVSGSTNAQINKCHSEVWEQPWRDFKQITVACENGAHRDKRGITGGEVDQDPTKPEYKVLAEESLRKYVLDSGIQDHIEVAEVQKVSTQVVAGSLTKIDFLVSGSTNAQINKCHSEVWEQPWRDFKQITVACENGAHRDKRGITGGEVDQDPTKPEYKVLAEESLRKYVLESGIKDHIEVAEVQKVSTQVVAGSLTKIDFLVSGSTNGQINKCHSEVWEQPWSGLKKITVTCENGAHRDKRGIPGGEEHQDPTKPEYKVLAEESLRKYVLDSGIQDHIEVAEVQKVSTQVVAGSLTKIDFLVSGSTNAQINKCHSEVWEQPWRDFKRITVTCENGAHRGKRGIPGGEEHQDPTKPEYKVLAEQSLRKYMKNSGITQPLEVVLIKKVSTQVVAGLLTRIDFVASNNYDSSLIICHSKILDQGWLNHKDINIACRDGGHTDGDFMEGDPTEPHFKELAEESLQEYLMNQPVVVRVDRVMTKFVSGMIEMSFIDFTVSGSDGTNKCHTDVWEHFQPNRIKFKVSCENKVHNGGVAGGLVDQDPSDPQYKELAEQSLQKYIIDSGTRDPLKVAQVESVSTQVVAGSMTRIDFLASGSPDSKTIKCHSEVWEQAWRNFKQITVSCHPVNERFKRDLGSSSGALKENLGTPRYKVLTVQSIREKSNNKGQQQVSNLRGHSEEEQDPTKPEYKLMAEESLRKLYRKKNTVYHTVLDVQRVVTHVVSGLKYKIDFTAAPTACLVNISSVRAHSCKAVDDIILYCHTDILDRPWLRQKKIEVQCNDPNNDNDLPSTPSDPQKRNDTKYTQLAEEASEKYLTTSNRKYIHKVTEILSASEQVTNDTLINIEYTISPTTCLRNETNNTSCKLKQPLVVFNCNANIRVRQLLQVEKEIKVTCKKVSETKSKKRKRESGIRTLRQVGDDDDEIDEDTAYYYADRAVQHINDASSSNNLHKLISIYAVKNSVQMGTLTIKMYIEVAETFCLRHHKSEDLRNCEEMNGLNHRLCLARLWPSPDDELVVRHVSVVCDDEADFMSITGVNILELIRISLAVLEAPPENKFKLVHQGEPQLIPSLDSRRPFKLNFVVSVTNCSKDVELDKNPFQCFLNPSIPPRNCYSLIWLKPEAKYISNVDAQCTPLGLGRVKRSALDSENITDYSEIQNMVTAALEKLEMQSLHRYKQRVLQINSHSTKITSGKVTTIDFDVGYTSCLKYEWVANITSCNFLEHLPRRRCVAQIWERLWINNGRNIDVNCVDDETPLESHIEFESAEIANELASQALKHIEAKYPHPSKQKVVRIFSLEKQVVAGIHYKMKIEVGFTDCVALSDQKDCKLQKNHGLNKFCRVNVWIRPWTDHPPNFRVSCDYQEGNTHDLYHHVQAEHLFYNFLTTYNPSYVNNYSQMNKRFEIFKNNIKKIHEFNVHEKGTAVYGVTRFTDLTYEEFSTTYMGLNTNLTNENQVPMKQADIPSIKVPESFDWREYDAVTEVKDQGSCGSCWAFSVTGNIEGQWKMQSGQLVSLSEQELVDCDKLDNGCSGGLPDNAYRAIEQLGGLELESDYPYEGTDDKCEFNKTLAKVQISSAVNITTNETGMAQWLVHNGPISIGINANAMQFYMGGISHPWKMLCNPTNLDHGVLIVGYGVKDYPLFHKKLPYWIIKNSWGKSWGEQGYYRVYRGDGTCGVNQMASSAVI